MPDNTETQNLQNSRGETLLFAARYHYHIIREGNR